MPLDPSLLLLLAAERRYLAHAAPAVHRALVERFPAHYRDNVMAAAMWYLLWRQHLLASALAPVRVLR